MGSLLGGTAAHTTESLMTPFTATHLLTWTRSSGVKKDFVVMLYNEKVKHFYTRDEWERHDRAEWVMEDGKIETYVGDHLSVPEGTVTLQEIDMQPIFRQGHQSLT